MALTAPSQMSMFDGTDRARSSSGERRTLDLEASKCFPLTSVSSRNGVVRVTSSRGTYIGQQLKRGVAFKGVPYACCERFEAPKRIEHVNEIDCTQAGPKAPQPDFMSVSGLLAFARSRVFGSVAKHLPSDMSETDCLNLQIYFPKEYDKSKPLPVFFFVHGGLFLFGSNQDELFQTKFGCQLATKHNMAVVLVNYRLGPFGFLKLPGVETNLGLRDVVAALEWVREEGTAFGLDSQSVTVAGQSAGAMLIGALLHVPSARGLFHRVVMMSGSSQNILQGRDADLVAEHLSSRVDVRTSTASELVAAAMSMVPEYGVMPFQPFYDGVFLCPDTCASGLDILTGVTDNEATIFVPRLPFGGKSMQATVDVLDDALGDHQLDCATTHDERAELITNVQESYPESSSNDVFRRLLSLVVFESPFIATVQQLKVANKVYVYRNMLGQGHCGELPFVFGTWNTRAVFRLMGGLPLWNNLSAHTQGTTMEGIWGDILSSFVASGVPPGTWPTFDDRELAMALSPDGMVEVPATAMAAKFMSRILLRHKRPYGLTVPQSTSKL